MRQHVDTGERDDGACRLTDPGGAGTTPGQLRAETLAWTHAVSEVVAAAEETGRAVDACRADPGWSGLAHDAFTAALDDLSHHVARVVAELRNAST